MTVEEKLLELAKKLVAKTDAGEVSWEETGEADKYLTTLPHTSVAIASTYDDREHGYAISLIDDTGRTIEYLYGGEYSSEGRGLEALYVRAKRKAHCVEQVLDEILAELA